MLLVPRTDPFLQQMFARMSPGAKFSFTPAQIDEIKKAFSARSFTSHDLDLRYSFSFFGKSYYLVFLAGRERRPASSTRVATKMLGALTALIGVAACWHLSIRLF
jgi:hypothetical protein